MDWNKGYSARFEVVKKNNDWTDGGKLSRIRSISIDRDCTDDTPLLESCGIEADVDSLSDAYQGWVRIDMVATQGGETVREPLGCFKLAATGASAEKSFYELSYEGVSVLSPADVAIGAGSYAPKGADGVTWASKRLSAVCSAPVESEGSFTLGDNIVFGDDDTVLSAVWQVLDTGNCIIALDGDGTVRIKPAPLAPTASFTAAFPKGVQGGVSMDGTQFSYTREYDPDIYLFTRAIYGLPTAGLSGTKTVVAQSLDCDKGVTVTETVEEGLWRR